MKKLPDAEFEVMQVVWTNEPPITTAMVMEQLGNRRQWKAPTIISLLQRLVERGFLRTEKNGKERTYYPLITRDEYLAFETKSFVRQYHGDSFLSLINTLYDGDQLSNQEIDDLMQWVKKRRK